MSERESRAYEIVNVYSTYSAGAGFIPAPLVDIAAIGALQLKMVHALARHFGVPFSRERGKALVGALLGSVGPTKLAYGAGGTLLKGIPLIGPFLGALPLPPFAFAATYAIGRVFVQHFESGGTLLDLDAKRAKAYVQQHLNGKGGEAGAATT